LLQKYNVEEDPIDPAPHWLSPLLSPSYLDTTRQVELKLEELELVELEVELEELEVEDLEGPLLHYLMKP